MQTKDRIKFILTVIAVVYAYTSFAQIQDKSLTYNGFLRIGTVFSENKASDIFDNKPGLGIEVNFNVRYDFGKWMASSGLSFGQIDFKSSLDHYLFPELTGYFKYRMRYNTISIPLLFHYSIDEKWSAYSGINFMWAYWASYSYSYETDAPFRESITSSREDIDDWQFAPEIIIGAERRFGQRFSLGLSISRGIHTLLGVNQDFSVTLPNNEVLSDSHNFEYRWTRIGIDIIYHFQF